MSLPKCEHGVSRGDGRYVGTYNAPFSECGCCGTMFPYIDSASFGMNEVKSRTWTPKDRCGACGGQYIERHDFRHPKGSKSGIHQGTGDVK